MKSAYDIFISYRRKDAQGSDKGVHIARTIKQYLEIKGYKGRVFFDYSELSNEDFDKRILSVIRQAKVFISVLTPDSMLRCVNDGDWVRRELMEAYNNKLQMIFINPDGREIAFPGGFPEELSFVKTRNHLTVHMDSSFERDMDDLIEKHIAPVSNPSDGSKSGKYAKVRVRTDHDCIIKRFDEEIGSAKVGEYSIVYLPKGKHRITFMANDAEAAALGVSVTQMFEVKDVDYEDYIEVSLKDVYDKRLKDLAISKSAESIAKKKKGFQELIDEGQVAMIRDNQLREKRIKKWTIYAVVAILAVIVGVTNVDIKEDSNLAGSKTKLGTINGHEYVDLGLPSGLKWATCNVGADSPEKYGDYYAWGEIETKGEYVESNSKTYGKLMSDTSSNAKYDVARANWGSSWRLPTEKELDELRTKCKWQWTTQNGKAGYKVTGPNGNSIFLPAAGYRYGSSLYDAGENGNYWSSSPNESNVYYAYYLGFGSSYHNVSWSSRYYGQSVRPVSE
ncbi:MAG: TIR domain-containing protein [Bacteroidales bacterium]|nr:TIR domain-containing protein [Bacteroidales bacterium]